MMNAIITLNMDGEGHKLYKRLEDVNSVGCVDGMGIAVVVNARPLPKGWSMTEWIIIIKLPPEVTS